MAVLTMNPIFRNIHGNIGKIIIYRRNGMQCCRIHVTPHNPRTEAQQANRASFADAVYSWQALSDEEKSRFRKRGLRRRMSGYNLFISEFMKSPERVNHKVSGVDNPLLSGLSEVATSVQPPFPPALSRISSEMSEVYDAFT